ncbi:MAG: hypothetical protein ACRDHK_05275, partial [Actinomycetota bacterium]
MDASGSGGVVAEGEGVGVRPGDGDDVREGVGVGDGVGEGVGVGDGVGDGVGVGNSTSEGGWKGCTGMPSVATDMNRCQMCAGIDPPKTAGNPPTSRMEMLPRGYPTHTHAASCGTYPQNQA